MKWGFHVEKVLRHMYSSLHPAMRNTMGHFLRGLELTETYTAERYRPLRQSPNDNGVVVAHRRKCLFLYSWYTGHSLAFTRSLRRYKMTPR